MITALALVLAFAGSTVADETIQTRPATPPHGAAPALSQDARLNRNVSVRTFGKSPEEIRELLVREQRFTREEMNLSEQMLALMVARAREMPTPVGSR
jgi:hypothetical protein